MIKILHYLLLNTVVHRFLRTQNELSANTETQQSAILEFLQVTFAFDNHFLVLLCLLHIDIAVHAPGPIDLVFSLEVAGLSKQFTVLPCQLVVQEDIASLQTLLLVSQVSFCQLTTTERCPVLCSRSLTNCSTSCSVLPSVSSGIPWIRRFGRLE